ncbi:MAG: ABC transporter permease [Frankiaceae bacterium]
MVRFAVRRILLMLVVLFVISIVVFGLFYARPGNPARSLAGRQASAQQVALVAHRLGLDQPVLIRYRHFAGRLFLHADLGTDFQNGESVRSELLQRLPTTASLTGGAVVLWLLAGIPIGVQAATRPRSARDRMATFFALVGLSMPTFVLGLLALYALYFLLTRAGIPLFPGGGYVPLTQDPLQWFRHLLLPWFTLAFVTAATYSRLTRGSLIDTLNEDYIRTARSKGLPERRVIYRHGMRTAVTPVLTQLGIDIGTLLGGAIVVETIFSLNGIGKFAVDSVFSDDQPVIVGTVLLGTAFIVVANAVVDMLYAVLDPRVRLS